MENSQPGNVNRKDKRILDSGDTRSMTSNISSLTSIRETDESVALGDRSAVKLAKVGTIFVTPIVDSVEKHTWIDEVTYVPELATNLLSESCIWKEGMEVDCKTGDNETGMVVVAQNDIWTVSMKGNEGRVCPSDII